MKRIEVNRRYPNPLTRYVISTNRMLTEDEARRIRTQFEKASRIERVGGGAVRPPLVRDTPNA